VYIEMNPIRLEYWQFLRDNPGSTITFSEWRSVRESKIREEEENPYSPYCSECSACGEEGCCSALMCKMSENGDYCGSYLKDLKFGYSVHNELLEMLEDDSKYKKKIDEILDRNFDRFYTAETKVDNLEKE